MSALQTFDFESNAVRVIMQGESPWFVAADVCRVLSISNNRDAVEKLDDDERGVALTDTLGGQQNAVIISESGLYTLILRSRDAVKAGTLPHRFRKWVTAEVLPALRERGTYALPEVPDAPEEEPYNALRAWGVPLPKINAIASMMRAVAASFGPEAAQQLYNTVDKGKLPKLGAFTNPKLMNAPAFDPQGCLKHLMRLATEKSMPLRSIFNLARRDAAAARSLQRYGLHVSGRIEDGFFAVAVDHPFLAKGFADTPWCGDWAKSLMALPGAKRVQREFPFGTHSYKVVLVPFGCTE